MPLPVRKFFLHQPVGLRLGASTTVRESLMTSDPPWAKKAHVWIKTAGEPSTVLGFPQLPCLGCAVAPCKSPRSIIQASVSLLSYHLAAWQVGSPSPGLCLQAPSGQLERTSQTHRRVA